MKTLRWLILAAVLPILARGASDETRAAELLRQLPNQATLREARNVVVYSASMFHQPIHRNEAELEAAKKRVEQAKEIVPKLRPLIKRGKSVFDYPGLLAHGDITFGSSSDTYQLYVGVYPRDNQGLLPYDFRITFDAKGTIVSVEDVTWKK